MVKCVNCGKERIAQGRIFNQVDYVAPAAYYRPEGLKPWALLDINVRIKNIFYACIDCGFVWADVDKEKLIKVLKEKAKPAVKNKLRI